ncbi:MAG: hypothetical protein KDH16_13170 [Rhodocyclaceae bacterium]|nr:hypothetical protein [Rhodocyclaceae bacterium]
MPRIDKHHLDQAAEARIISPTQAEDLWAYLCAHAAAPAGPRFDLTHVLYYLGGMLAIGAMSVFMNLGWESFGGWGIVSIALLYFGIAWQFAGRFERQGLAVPMGIMATLCIVLVPLATWGLQHALGLWVDAPHADQYRDYHRYVDRRWLTLELATLAAGCLMLWRWRAPFMLMPIAVTLWYLSMDLAMLLVAPASSPWNWSSEAWTFRKWFSVSFGAITLLGAFWIDLRNRSRQDYSFWLYLFGLFAFWGGLSSLGSDLLAGKLIYLAINLTLIGIGAALLRRTFTVFGAIGVAIVLGDFSRHLFRDAWLFPIALTAIGLAVIYAGVWWSRHEQQLSARLRACLPESVQPMLARRGSA